MKIRELLIGLLTTTALTASWGIYSGAQATCAAPYTKGQCVRVSGQFHGQRVHPDGLVGLHAERRKRDAIHDRICL